MEIKGTTSTWPTKQWHLQSFGVRRLSYLLGPSRTVSGAMAGTVAPDCGVVRCLPRWWKRASVDDQSLFPSISQLDHALLYKSNDGSVPLVAACGMMHPPSAAL